MKRAATALALLSLLGPVFLPGCSRSSAPADGGPTFASALPPPSSAGPSDAEGHLSRDYTVAMTPPAPALTTEPRATAGPPVGPESEHVVRRARVSGPIGGRPYAPDARGTTCISNVRQLGTGLLCYVQDWDERCPPGEGWPAVTEPYLRSASVLECPSDDREPSYAFNPALSRRPFSDVFEPAYTVSLFESDDLEAVAYRHDGGSVCGFADGDARWIERGWERRDPVLWSLEKESARGR